MTLSVNYTFKGHGNWSLDGTGGSATGGGTIDAIIPTNSHIEAAFLYQGSLRVTLDARRRD